MINMNKSKLEKDIEINYWRQHIIDGLLTALKNPDKIKEILKNKDNTKIILTEKLGFSPQQAGSLMDLRKPIDEIDEKSILKEQRDLKQIEVKLKAQKS